MSARKHFRNALLARASRLRAQRHPAPSALAEFPIETQVSVDEMAISHLLNVEAAARQVIEMMAMMGVDGPVFSLNQQDHEEADVAALRHAILTLQGILGGAPAPAFALPIHTEIN